MAARSRVRRTSAPLPMLGTDGSDFGMSLDGPTDETPQSSLTRLAVRGAGLSGVGYVVAQGLNLGAYVVLARLLSPSDFGVFAAATALLGLTLLLTESGMTSALVQRRDRVEEAANTALLASIVSGVGFGLLALATAPLLGYFFGNGEIGAIAAAMSGVITLRILTVVPDALLQRRFAFLRRLVIEPAQVTVFAAASIIAASNGLGAWSLVIGQYAGIAVDVILAWGLVRWRPRPRLATFEMWRELVGYGRHILVATSILRAGEQSDALIIGKVISEGALGQFRYAFRVASTPFLLLLSTAAYVLFPAFSRIATEAGRFQEAFLRSLRWMMILALPMSFVLIPLGEPITVVVFGPEWNAAGHAVAAMFAYTAAGTVSSVVSEALKAYGRPDRLSRMHTIATIATAGTMFALAPISLTAAAASMSIGAALSAAYAIGQSRSIMNVPLARTMATLAAPLAASLVMAATLLGIEAYLDAEAHGAIEGLGLLAIEGLLAAAVYAAALSALDRSVWSEARQLLGTLRGGGGTSGRSASET